MKKYSLLMVLFLTGSSILFGQPIDNGKFFSEDAIIDVTLTTDFKKLQAEKKLDVYQPASISIALQEGTVKEDVTVAARGHFRRDNCVIPPLRVDFSNPSSPRLTPLGKLKLVIGCGTTREDDQLVLKEYLVYKIYNLLEDKSFRVRLVKLNYDDARGKVKTFSQHAFFIEDDKDMAARNGCVMNKQQVISSKYTDRNMMTMIAIFQYMISNGDWGIDPTTVHNLKLICNKDQQDAPPLAVPYDFDHSGFVNASYATPAEQLGTEYVTQRVYRGYPRSMEELEAVFNVYRAKKDAIFSLINNFKLLKEVERKGITAYLAEFYSIINNKRMVEDIFIKNTPFK